MKNILSVRNTRFILTLAMILTIVAAPFNGVFAQKTSVKKPLMQSDNKAQQRASALLARMTLDEKIGQMNQLFFFSGSFKNPNQWKRAFAKARSVRYFS